MTTCAPREGRKLTNRWQAVWARRRTRWAILLFHLRCTLWLCKNIAQHPRPPGMWPTPTRHHKHHRGPVSPQKKCLSWSPACSTEKKARGAHAWKHLMAWGLARKRKAFWDSFWLVPSPTPPIADQTKAKPSLQRGSFRNFP